VDEVGAASNQAFLIHGSLLSIGIPAEKEEVSPEVEFHSMRAS